MKARTSRSLLAGAVPLMVALSQAGAQDRSAWVTGVHVAPTFRQWTFATPLGGDTTQVKGASQLALPVSFTAQLGESWTFDASGAVVRGVVRVVTSTAESDLTLNGVTDLRLRLVGRVAGDRMRLTLGVNAPTGSTSLDAEQVRAIRVLGATALRMPAPALGSGFGATGAAVAATQAGEWAVALGAAYELRGRYEPVEAQILGATAVTDLDPADAIRLTLGADRLVGSHRLSFLFGTEIYGESRLTVDAGGGSSAEGNYKVGPAFTGLAVLELGVQSFRELTVSLSNRYRSSFRGIDGVTAAGSSGNYLDFQVRGVLGAPRRPGLIVGVDGHADTGLEVDNSIATAAVTAIGGVLGASLPAGGMTLEPFVRVQVGNLDTGAGSSSIRGITAGVLLTTSR